MRQLTTKQASMSFTEAPMLLAGVPAQAIERADSLRSQLDWQFLCCFSWSVSISRKRQRVDDKNTILAALSPIGLALGSKWFRK